jgi:anthranilate phosphoribosyltransferase
MASRVLVIDNYDSFTFNLVQYLGELGAVTRVVKNDEIDVDGILRDAPMGVLISPGPCTPNEAGVSLACIERVAGKIPIFGVCLGHQSIGQAFGGKVVRAGRLMHGKTSPIEHDGLRVAVRGDALPLAPRRARQRARRAGDQRVDGGGRDHGPAPQDLAGRRGAVSPRERAHARGQADHRQLALVVGRRGMSASFPELFAALEDRGATPDEVHTAFDAILAGAWTPVQTAAYAIALRMRGETKELIVAAAESLRARMSALDHGLPMVVDTCGTGGDGARTLNISTAAAVVVAACGLKVAKHGNRSVSSQCGSADVIEALGLPLALSLEGKLAVLREAGIVFLMAPAHHPALAHAAQARRELGVRTIFNALGPLANPARATHQLVGVYEDRLRPILASALGTLGVVRAWVVRGEDGLDEVSPCGPTRVSELEGGVVRERVVVPEDFGIARAGVEVIAGGDARTNALAIEQILRGDAHLATDTVVLNAAAVLVAIGEESSPKSAAARARAAIAEGHAWRVLVAWREATNRHAAKAVPAA